VFNSGITAAALIEDIKSEVDAAPEIPDSSYLAWLDETEQLLYSEIIRELVVWKTATGASVARPFDLSVIKPSALYPDAAEVRFEDIYAVYINGVQLAYVTPVGAEFPDTYWKQDGKLYFNVDGEAEDIKIFYYVRPALKSFPDATDTTKPKDNSEATVKLPFEWLPLIKAKIRAEAYKLVNDGGMAAKWLNDYTALLEHFKRYIEERRPRIGV
jgi:hypothetical protein